MSTDQEKQMAAKAAIDYIEDDTIVGVGTGSTANYFIEYLAQIKGRIEGAVASSEETAKRLKQAGIPVFDLNVVDQVPVYVDGADESDRNLCLIKGGGGALTREKILAAVADKFICIADSSKKVSVLGRFPLPVEVIPMARSHVAKAITRLGGDPAYRAGFTTDNGNIILDIHNMEIAEPVKLEAQLNNVVGVVTNGLFAKRPADVLLLASAQGVQTISS